MLFILAVYRRGRNDSASANVVADAEEDYEELIDDADEVELDVPAPVVEDDDIELLDELDQI